MENIVEMTNDTTEEIAEIVPETLAIADTKTDFGAYAVAALGVGLITLAGFAAYKWVIKPGIAKYKAAKAQKLSSTDEQRSEPADDTYEEEAFDEDILTEDENE